MTFQKRNLPNILTVSRIFAVLIFVAIASVAHIDVISCIRLAAAIGVYPEQLNDLGEFEKRFDSANARWRKSH